MLSEGLEDLILLAFLLEHLTEDLLPLLPLMAILG
jgi:hypothetical protein